MGLITVIIDYYAVARGGIEPPTHGFSVRFNRLLLNFIGLYQLLLIVELQSIKAKSIVIECCQFLGNNTAYRHLYGHLFFVGIASLTFAHGNDLIDSLNLN